MPIFFEYKSSFLNSLPIKKIIVENNSFEISDNKVTTYQKLFDVLKQDLEEHLHF